MSAEPLMPTSAYDSSPMPAGAYSGPNAIYVIEGSGLGPYRVTETRSDAEFLYEVRLDQLDPEYYLVEAFHLNEVQRGTASYALLRAEFNPSTERLSASVAMLGCGATEPPEEAYALAEGAMSVDGDCVFTTYDSILTAARNVLAGLAEGVVEIDAQPLARRENGARLATPEQALAATEEGNRAWYALLAEDFLAAEAAARRGLELDPNQTWIALNLAHALLLQERLAEADAIYDAHRGERLPQQGDRLWEEVVAEDFAGLRADGSNHQHMNAVLSRLAN